MSAHNRDKMRVEIKCEACRAFYHVICNEFDKLNNTGARILCSFYHMTIKLLKIAF